MVEIKRFDVLLVELNPTKGSELKKTRPCVVISPDSMNESALSTIIIAPLTSTIRIRFPTRIAVNFQDKKGQVALDQLRVINRSRARKNLGHLNSRLVQKNLLDTLHLMFSE